MPLARHGPPAQRRRSGRVDTRGKRGSFETVRLPTGALTDVFASRVPPAACAAGAAAPPPAGDRACASACGAAGAYRAAPAGGAAGGAAPAAAVGAAMGSGLYSSQLSLKRQPGAERPKPAPAPAPAAGDGSGGWGDVKPLMAQHDAIQDGSLTAALIAAGAIKAPSGSPSAGGSASAR